GDDNLMIELEEPIVISGRVVGPLERLPQKDGKPYIRYTCTFTANNFSDTDSTQCAFVDVEGDQGFFELTDLWGTSVRLGMDHWKQRIKLNEPIPDEIVLDLNDPLTENGQPYHSRQLVLEFQTLEGFPPPTGNIRLNYIDPAYADNTYKGKLVEIIDGKAQAEIVAPGKIAYEIADTVGYWFKEVRELKVDDGTEPLVIQVPTIPAGMIFGQVFEEDGTPAVNTMVSCQIIKKSPLLDEKTHYSVSDLGKNSSSDTEIETKYTAAPLPLGGIYQLVAHRKNTYAVSEPIELTEENPIWEVNLTFPKGVTVSGQVFAPDGTPAGGIKCHLHFGTSNNHGFGNQGQFTDSQGCFAFEQTNPDADGSYSFSIKSKKDYRPMRMELKRLTKPIVVQLEQGAIATGQIIDKKTGWPIPNVEVSAWYHNYKQENSEYERFSAEAKTDKDGRFRFSNMKPGREYHLTISECRQDDTGIIGGQTKDKAYEVTPYDWSELKPRQPEDS
ncbi:MAG: carboxypeptidase-like regulatory domain-containing protein, partial [Planctomycetota bacterium]